MISNTFIIYGLCIIVFNILYYLLLISHTAEILTTKSYWNLQKFIYKITNSKARCSIRGYDN